MITSKHCSNVFTFTIKNQITMLVSQDKFIKMMQENTKSLNFFYDMFDYRSKNDKENIPKSV